VQVSRHSPRPSLLILWFTEPAESRQLDRTDRRLRCRTAASGFYFAHATQYMRAPLRGNSTYIHISRIPRVPRISYSYLLYFSSVQRKKIITDKQYDFPPLGIHCKYVCIKTIPPKLTHILYFTFRKKNITD
jgi:hypothetical protein